MVAMSAVRLLLIAYISVALPAGSRAQTAGTAKETQRVSSPYAAEELGTISNSLGRRDLDLRAALSAQPDAPELLFAYALVLREEGKARDSLAVYTRAAAFSPRPTADELRSAALDYVLLSDYDNAIHWLETAEQIDPKNQDVLSILSAVLLLLKGPISRGPQSLRTDTRDRPSQFEGGRKPWFGL